MNEPKVNYTTEEESDNPQLTNIHKQNLLKLAVMANDRIQAQPAMTKKKFAKLRKKKKQAKLSRARNRR